MSKNIKLLGLCLFISSLLMGTISCVQKTTKNYYFDEKTGSDANSGTSKNSPFKNLAKLKLLQLNPGDSILLATNQVFHQPIELINVSGSKEQFIVVSSYSEKDKHKKAVIETKGFLNGILIENSSFIKIHNIQVSAKPSEEKSTKKKAKQMRCGVLVKVSEKRIFEHIYLSNITVSDVFYEKENFLRPKNEVKSANGTQNYGWGIRFINNTKKGILKNIKVDSSLVTNVSHTGIKLTSINGTYGILDVVISNTKVFETGGPGIQMSGVKNGHIFNNTIDASGSNNDARKWGRGSGLWTWGSSEVLIEKNKFRNAKGPGDSAGAHIDFNCNNVVLQYNLSVNNSGGFCEILGNNYNCAYRYNISVNDGYRVKGKNNAFQEGKIFWLSGYVGMGKRKGPYNSYFYNNTIYVKKGIQVKMAISKEAQGILIANNIFYIEGNSKLVQGDQYNPEKEGKWLNKNIFFQNNLFLHTSSWPAKMTIQDKKPLFGNPKFKNAGGLLLEDYIPKNKNLVQNRGIIIPKIKNDSLGIFYGLHPHKDILGNVIKDLPDLGAIEIK